MEDVVEEEEEEENDNDGQDMKENTPSGLKEEKIEQDYDDHDKIR